MNYLRSLIEEKPGLISAARVILLMTFLICIAAPIVTVIYASWGKEKWVTPDVSTLDFCKWAFVAALGGKVSQAIWAEKDTPSSPPAP